MAEEPQQPDPDDEPTGDAPPEPEASAEAEEADEATEAPEATEPDPADAGTMASEALEATEPDPADAGTMASEALEAAESAMRSVQADAAAEGEQPLDLPDFAPSQSDSAAEGITLLSDVNLKVKVELGRTCMYVEDVLRLGPGSVVELDKSAGDPVDIFVNDRHVARGEVLVVNDNFCVRVSEIVKAASFEE